MEPINRRAVQNVLEQYSNHDIYLHLETTTGAPSSLKLEKTMTVGSFIKNGRINFSRGVITGDGPYSVGLKLEHGWVYAEGLTDWEVDAFDRLLLAGHDHHGRLAVALELSETPFKC